jgi:hypothetical protein
MADPQIEAGYQRAAHFVDATPTNVAVSSAGAAAALTWAAVPGQRHTLTSIFFSYSAAPASPALLTIEDGSGNIVFETDVTASGAGPLDLGCILRGTVNTAMIVTLGAGGGSVVARLSVPSHKAE